MLPVRFQSKIRESKGFSHRAEEQLRPLERIAETNVHCSSNL
jgi:hypothetical protein